MSSLAHAAAPAGRALGLDHLNDIARQLTLTVEAEHFYFLRHGQTECNARRIFQSYEEPLNATGIAQARAAGEVLANEAITTIVCSDVPRTRLTAELVAAHHNLPPQDQPLLRERNFGELVGSSSAQIDWDCAPAQGETLEFFVQRTRDGLQAALAEPGPVLVVAHGGILYVLAALLDVPLSPALLGNAHPLRFERTDSGWAAIPLAAATTTNSINIA